MSVLIHIITFCSLVFIVEAARILAVFPCPSISHQVVFRPFTQELVRRGHELVIITTDPAFEKGATPTNLTEIDVHDISYKLWTDLFVKKASKGRQDEAVMQLKVILEVMVDVVDALINEINVKNMIQDKNQKFDLILSEAFVRPALIFSHIYKAPVILVSSFSAVYDNYAVIGAPQHPFLYPIVTQQSVNNLTLWEKLWELRTYYQADQMQDSMKEPEHNMLKKNFGEDTPSMDDLNNNVDMLFLNVHPIFEGIRPLPPSVIFMGSLHQKPSKELPVDLKYYLDSSKHGVIYISFGTNVDPSLLPPEKIQTFVKTFSKLPYDVLWKWNKDELPGRTENIKISKWFPQSDLLKHPKIKLFITQGGLQSTDEAITAGVPLIGIPMLGDQWFNTGRYEYHKIGIKIDLESLTEERLKDAISTIIGNENYRNNIKRLRKLLHDQPMKPLDRAIWWTEYVIRHGGAKHLRSPSANITWRQYLELDLIYFVFGILLVLVSFSIIVLVSIYKILSRCLRVKIKNA